MLVVRTRVGSMASKRYNSVSEVWPSCRHRIYKEAEGLLVCPGINSRGREFEEVFICQGERGNGAGILHSIVLQSLIYKLLLQK